MKISRRTGGVAMKRWIDLIAVILLAVMLAACGKQQREVLAGQGEDPGSLEQT